MTFTPLPHQPPMIDWLTTNEEACLFVPPGKGKTVVTLKALDDLATIGADEAARSTGLEMIKEWASAEDSRTRPSHAEADGDEVPLDEPFVVGDARLMVPGDPSGPAKEIINCRCAILHHPVIGGEVIR